MSLTHRQTPGRSCARIVCSGALALLATGLLAAAAPAAPKVVVISLDGATPRITDQLLADGALPALRALRDTGVEAKQNLTTSPSLTAPGHITIATGTNAAGSDVLANSFHLSASPFNSNISGFSAPIGGYSIDGPGETLAPTAVPVWTNLLAAGKTVVTATFPGGDGLDVTAPGLSGSPLLQNGAKRTVTYTIPFGAFAGPTGTAFRLSAANFGPAPAALIAQLAAAGHPSSSPVRVTTNPIESFTSGGVAFGILAAALDTTNDGSINYDTLVFFDQTLGVPAGPFAAPSTGPAYVKASEGKSAPFYLEGSSQKAGCAFYVTALAADLSNVRFVRYSANFIPRNPKVGADVDDVNANVGFWADQSDFRFTERLAPGLLNVAPTLAGGAANPAYFSDAELEAIFEDQVRLFLDYQTRLAVHAIQKNPNADLVMVYLEQPDGSEHQFLLTDPRQPSDPSNPNSIGANQDVAKKARYANYIRAAYAQSDAAVGRILAAVGQDTSGRPASTDVFVVSDHGFNIFHTAVGINNLLAGAGLDPAVVRAVASGPAVNVYISLQGREANGVVSKNEYLSLQQQVVAVLKNAADTNLAYTNGAASVPLFDKVYARPASLSDPLFGRRTDKFIGQDSGDVVALLNAGYNFDGTQSPIILRRGDAASARPVLSLPNFYGAHGYDPALPNMSAIFFAAGPHVGSGTLTQVRNIDIAPTVSALLGVKPAPTVQGRVLTLASAPLSLTGAASRKAHGVAGVFDLPLPLSGAAGVEGRAGGPTQLVFTFSSNIVSATVTTSGGTVGAPAYEGNDVSVPLSGAIDGKILSVTLTNVTDVFGSVLPSVTVPVGALLGDINGSGVVDAADVNLVKSETGLGLVLETTFTGDVTASGGINAADVSQVKARVGHSL